MPLFQHLVQLSNATPLVESGAGSAGTSTDGSRADHIHPAASGGSVATDVIYDAKGDLPVGTGSDTAAKLTVGSNGQAVIADSAAATGLKYVDATRVLRSVIDGAGVVLATGAKTIYLSVPIDCTITKARVLADQSGSVVLDVWKDTYANFPPTVADTITASAKPTLSSAQKSEDATLTGWTTTLSAGDVLEVNVDSATTVTKVYLDLFVKPR